MATLTSELVALAPCATSSAVAPAADARKLLSRVRDYEIAVGPRLSHDGSSEPRVAGEGAGECCKTDRSSLAKVDPLRGCILSSVLKTAAA
eukprot:2430289-Pyramimonas_sp.AAC.1